LNEISTIKKENSASENGGPPQVWNRLGIWTSWEDIRAACGAHWMKLVILVQRG
jgi:hypothetical protein